MSLMWESGFRRHQCGVQCAQVHSATISDSAWGRDARCFASVFSSNRLHRSLMFWSCFVVEQVVAHFVTWHLSSVISMIIPQVLLTTRPNSEPPRRATAEQHKAKTERSHPHNLE
eukprot:scaffold7684_cov119-Isochrysis_galbana.AAC.11